MKIKFKNIIKKLWRAPFVKSMRRKLNNDNFIILSSNCVGGCLLHDLGKQFNTPTINLTIPKFISFVERLEHYLSIKPLFVKMDKYPIFKIDDIIINGVHYKSDYEFLSSWDRRTNRLLDDLKSGKEIFIMATDAQLHEKDAVNRFLRLPYKKVCFTSKKELLKNKEFIYVPEFDGQENVGDLTKFTGIKGKRIFQKYFDCVGFLNALQEFDKIEVNK